MKYFSIKKVFVLSIIFFTFFIGAQKAHASDCAIFSGETGFLPTGQQANDWFTDAHPPSVDVLVKTAGCAGKNLTLIILQTKSLSSDVPVISQDITVPNSGYFSAHFTAGTKACSNLHNPDCDYYLEIKTPTETITPKDQKLQFNCDAGCTNDKIEWKFNNMAEINTDPVVVGNCADGIDNDGDGLIDKDDPDCSYSGIGTDQNYAGTNTESGKFKTFDELTKYLQDKKTAEDIANGITTPTPVSPQSNFNQDYNLLAPLPGLSTISPTGGVCPADPSIPNGVGCYLNIMVKIIIGICGALAVVMIVIGGIQYMGDESIFGKTEARSRILMAIGGLLLALGAWAILNTINPALLESTISIPVVTASLQPDSNVPQNGTYVNGVLTYCGKYSAGSPTNQNWDNLAGGTEQATRDDLTKSGITVASPACTWVGQPRPCTSVSGLNESKIKDLATACKTANGGTSCDVNISGGTECWLHGGDNGGKTQHGPGLDMVDLSVTGSLSKYIEAGTSKTMSVWGGKGVQYTTKDGLVLVKESSGGDHYHFGSH